MNRRRFASVTVIGFLLLSAQAWSFCFDEAGLDYDISPELLRTIARVESKMDAKALNVNSNGTTDIGLMQINSWWLRVLGLDERELIENPCHNVKTGARILSQCIDRYGYNWKAVGCYNAYSEHKKILYSWKIYNELKKAESDRKQAVADEKPVLEKARKSELHFTVKEILPYCAGEEP